METTRLVVVVGEEEGVVEVAIQALLSRPRMLSFLFYTETEILYCNCFIVVMLQWSFNFED